MQDAEKEKEFVQLCWFLAGVGAVRKAGSRHSLKMCSAKGC